MKQRYQSGMSTISWLLVLVMVVVVATCLVKMVPVYVEDRYVVDALKSLAENESDLTALSKQQIMSSINKYTTINAVSSEASKGFEVRRYKRRLIVNSNYEVRVPVAFNIDVVMRFRSQLDTENPDLCCRYYIEEFDEQR